MYILCFSCPSPQLCHLPWWLLHTSVAWTVTVEDVRIAGTPQRYGLAPDGERDDEKLLLGAWLQERFGEDDAADVSLYSFMRCETRRIFLRCKRYSDGSDDHGGAVDAEHAQAEATASNTEDRRVDYCVQVAEPMPGVVGAADAELEANWYCTVELMFAARLPPQLGRNAVAITEFLALVQPLAVVPHYVDSVDVTQLPEGWEKVAQWITGGELLSHAVTVSLRASALLPLRMVRLRDIVGKRCLLDTPGFDKAMVMRMQNFVEEL